MGDIIPAGERGTFTITDSQLMETDSVSMSAFEALIMAEAERRGLQLAVSEDVVTRDMTVRWRPREGRSCVTERKADHGE